MSSGFEPRALGDKGGDEPIELLWLYKRKSLVYQNSLTLDSEAGNPDDRRSLRCTCAR